MWMDAYVEEILLRQRIAEAQHRAAVNQRTRGPEPLPARRGIRALLSRLLRRRTHPALRERRV